MDVLFLKLVMDACGVLWRQGVYGGGKDEWEPVPLVVSIYLRRCLNT